MANEKKKTGSFLTEEAKEIIQELLDIDGGGGSGTMNYDDLSNKPSVNNVALSGNKSLSDLGIASENDLNVMRTATQLDAGKALIAKTIVNGKVTQWEFSPVCKQNEYVVSIRDYGAVGDGVTDDTSAIQSAVNSGARIIKIPAGKYHTTESILIEESDKFFIGDAYNGSSFCDSVEGGTFKVTNGASSIRFRNFEIETSDNPNGLAFYLDNASFITIENVNILGGSFRGTKSRCIYQSGATWSTLLINHCIFDCGVTNGWAIYLENTSGSNRSVDCHMDDLFLDALKHENSGGGCLYTSGCNDINIQFCLFRSKSNGSCLQMESGSVINQSSSLQGGANTVVINGGTYSTRNGTENQIINNSLVNRFDNGIFDVSPSKEYFTTQICRGGYSINEATDGRISFICRGNNSFNTNLLLVPSTQASIVRAKFGFMSANVDKYASGLVLYDSTNQKFKLFGLAVKNNILNIVLQEYTVNTEPSTLSNSYLPISGTHDMYFSAIKNQNGIWNFAIREGGAPNTNVFSNESSFTFDYVGMGFIQPSVSSENISITRIDNFSFS